MKCPECGTKHKSPKTTRSPACPSCGYRYVLRPDADKISDSLLSAAIRKASSSDTQYFTLSQLYAAVYRIKRPGPAGMVAGAVIALAAILLVAFTGADFLIFFAFIGVVIFVITFSRRRRPPVPNYSDFQGAVQRYRGSVSGKLDKLVDKPALRQPPPNWPESDIYDYGAERILFVERDVLVDLFVKNGWHAENHALVLSVEGYPSYIKERAQALMREDAELPIFLMHDATSDVGALMDRIRSDYRLGDREITDLGLGPDDAQRFQDLRRVSGQHHVPLDLVPYGTLAVATGAAVVTGVLLTEALREQASPGAFAGGHSGGDFG